MKREPITLSHTHPITIKDILQIGSGKVLLNLHPDTANLLDDRRAQVLAFIQDTGKQAYGFNRGFGHNVKESVSPELARRLQVNLIRSHASGVGPPAPDEIVRMTMALRASSLARGASGVRAEVVRSLLNCLNAGITPVVPRLGSVSASGDLAPLSHIALALIGEGEVTYRDRRQPAKQALADARLAPLELQEKEGLALNNGVQYTTALGVYCVDRLDTLLKTACVITAMSAQVMLAADTPFRADLHGHRPHVGAQQVARWIFELMRDSPIRESHRAYEIDGEIQDPYNLRCAPQVLGACRELLARAEVTLQVEMNSVTDNPLILQATETNGWKAKYGGRYLDQYVDIVSGGHFHGMPVAVDMYGLLQAMAIMARLSNMRSVRYVDEARNKGLGPDLKWPGRAAEHSISSGMMIPEYVSAALTNWIWGVCMPSHLFSLSTDAGQEDHVSMGANVALRVYDTLPRLAEVLAIELAFAAQAAAIRREMNHIPSYATDDKASPWRPEQRRLNKVGEEILEKVATVFPVVETDRPLSDELQKLAALILAGDILQVTEDHVNFT